ncbi:MAG: ABC transporter substrate-binding protein [Desulfobacteraceae bacterium]|nr:ABC transporter substrate-binding protein [Desulfobacteraceae bacterium]
MKNRVVVSVVLVLAFMLTACAGKKILPEPEPPVTPPVEQVEEPVEPAQPTEPEKPEVETLLDLVRTLEETADLAEVLRLYNAALKMAADEERVAEVRAGLNRFLATRENESLEAVLQSEGDLVPRGAMMYRLGLNYANQNKNQQAVDMLSAFVRDYPDHSDAENAGEILLLLKEHLFKKSTVGCLLPLSGRFSVFGERALKGVELAVRDLSREYSQNIKVIIRDTRSGDGQAVSCVEDLAAQRVAGIAGPIITAGAAGLKAQEMGVPMIALTQKSQIARTGEYVFSNFLTPEIQARALVSYATRVLGVKRFAMLYPEDRYGRTYMNLFWDRVDEMGGEIVGAESYGNDKTDFSDAIKKLTGLYYPVPEDLKPKEDGEDLLRNLGEDAVGSKAQEEEEEKPIVDFKAVFIPDAPSKVGMILPQLVYHDVTGCYLLGTNIWHDPILIDTARRYAKKTVITDGFFVGSRNPEARRFAEDFRSLHGQYPGFIEAAAYDTICMMVRTVMEPGVDSRTSLMEALSGRRVYEGVTGRTLFDQDGNARKELVFLTIKKGEFVEITR